MGRTAAFIFTGILAVCFVLPLVTRSAKMIPRGISFAALAAVAIVWILAVFKGMPLGLKIPLNIVFYFIFAVVALPAGIGSLIFGIGDRERYAPPVVVGGNGSKGRIAIVYHPGMSPFTERSIRKLAADLNAKGYSATLMTANRKTVVEPSYKAVVVSSPVYGGMTRPPLDDFLAANNPLPMPCFAFLTGGGPASPGVDVERIDAMVKMEGGTYAGGTKIAHTAPENARETEISSFAEKIAAVLEKK
jgi:hypothetical protein